MEVVKRATFTEATSISTNTIICTARGLLIPLAIKEGFMRVLIEYKGKRVDIKDPISMRDKREEEPEHLGQLINEALAVVKG